MSNRRRPFPARTRHLSTFQPVLEPFPARTRTVKHFPARTRNPFQPVLAQLSTFQPILMSTMELNTPRALLLASAFLLARAFLSARALLLAYNPFISSRSSPPCSRQGGPGFAEMRARASVSSGGVYSCAFRLEVHSTSHFLPREAAKNLLHSFTA